jgi:YD repeat-containing protein
MVSPEFAPRIRAEYETDPIGKKLRYTYYDNGLLREKYDATSIQTLLVTYTYNSRGQLENKLFTDGTYEHYSLSRLSRKWTFRPLELRVNRLPLAC